MRIGLFSPKTQADRKTLKTTDVTHIEAASVAELSKALNDLGAKRVGLFWRDRVGAGHLEGEMMAASDLTEANFAWLGASNPGEYQLRGLFFARD